MNKNLTFDYDCYLNLALASKSAIEKMYYTKPLSTFMLV